MVTREVRLYNHLCLAQKLYYNLWTQLSVNSISDKISWISFIYYFIIFYSFIYIYFLFYFIFDQVKNAFRLKSSQIRLKHMTIINTRMRSKMLITSLTSSHLHYDVIQRGCEVISGRNYRLARNCPEHVLDYIVIQMRKANRGESFKSFLLRNISSSKRYSTVPYCICVSRLCLR